MKSKVPRVPILSTLALLLLITLLVLWARSPRHADVVAFYTPTGHLDGMASDRGGMLFCASDIPFGEEMGLTADAMSSSADEFAAIHATLFDPSSEKWHFLGFHVAAGTLGTWRWKFNAILVPYWALLIPLAIPPMFGFRRVIVRACRKRRGQCLACGYDLRQSPERCPECGRPVAGRAPDFGDATAPLDTRSVIRSALGWVAVGGILAVGVAGILRGRHAAAALATTPPELKLLDRNVAHFEADGLVLDDAAAALGRSAHALVSVEGIVPKSAPNGSPVRATLWDVKLNEALRVVCRLTIGDPQHALQIWASHSKVYAGDPSRSPEIVRAYPVGGLVRRFQADIDRAFRDWPPPPPPKNVTSMLYPAGSSEPASVEQVLPRLIEDMVRPEDWADNGGSLGATTMAAGRLWVCQTQEGHADVRAALALLESPDSPTGVPATKPASNPHANLEQRIPELKLDSTTLEGAIETLRQSTQANLVVYWKQLEAAGLGRDTPIRLHLWDVTLDQALGAILTVAGGEHPGMRAVRDGMIVIAAPEEIRNGSMSMRVYDIRDLIEKYLTEDRLALLYPTTGPTNREQGAKPGTYQDTVDSIVRLIEDTVDTDSWKDNGGSVGALRELAGRLIITQTPAAHRQIAALLRTLRTGGSKEGTEVPANTR